MVEAAAVLPVLAAFFVVFLFVARAQQNRHHVQADAFREAMTYASSACEGDGPRVRDPRLVMGGDTPRRATDMSRGAGTDGSLDRQLNAAHAQRTRSITVGRLTSTTSSDARVLCNEKPLDGSPLGFFEYGIRTFKSYFPDKVGRPAE